MVQEVEELRTKLRIPSLAWAIFLAEGKVHIGNSRPDQCVSRHISKESQRLDHKLHRIKVAFRGPVIAHRIVMIPSGPGALNAPNLNTCPLQLSSPI